jgi:hypothetical protein
MEGKTMRHNPKRSSRGGRPQQQNNNGNKNGRMRVYDSNGPEARIRGTAFQITEKYELLAKDAETSGNSVLAENYRQHAEHYQRIINSFENESVRSHDQKSSVEDDNNDDDLGLPASIIGVKQTESDMVTA